MITIQDMLKLKEQELTKLQKEIDALRLVASLYGETALIDANRPPAESMAQISASSAAPVPPQIFAPSIAAVVTAPPPPPTPMPMLARAGGEKRFP